MSLKEIVYRIYIRRIDDPATLIEHFASLAKRFTETDNSRILSGRERTLNGFRRCFTVLTTGTGQGANSIVRQFLHIVDDFSIAKHAYDNQYDNRKCGNHGETCQYERRHTHGQRGFFRNCCFNSIHDSSKIHY
jgi:hypothetical protein